MEKIEYRVRPVKRCVVTRFDETNGGCSSVCCGEFDNETQAERIRDALVAAEMLEKPEAKITAEGIFHLSDCAKHNAPAYQAGACDCGATEFKSVPPEPE